MAFTIKTLARLGSSQTNDIPTQWSYNSDVDSIADMFQANYFDESGDVFQVGDFINARGAFGEVDLFHIVGIFPVMISSVITGLAGPPKFIIVLGGSITTTGGAQESLIIPGAQVSDLGFAQIEIPSPSAPNVSVRAADIKAPGTMQVNFTEDALSDTQVHFFILRAA